jgi:hypothetical protein
MRRALGWTLGVTLVIAVLLSLLIGAVLVFELPQHVGSISIDGREFAIHDLTGGHWLVASLGVLVALLVILMLIPVVLVVALLAPLLTIGAVAIPTLALAALMVVVFVWPIVWLVRRLSSPSPSKRTTTAAGATTMPR